MHPLWPRHCTKSTICVESYLCFIKIFKILYPNPHLTDEETKAEILTYLGGPWFTCFAGGKVYSLTYVVTKPELLVSTLYCLVKLFI